MTTALYIVARTVLLDALDALGEQRDAVVGAQDVPAAADAAGSRREQTYLPARIRLAPLQQREGARAAVVGVST